MSTPFERPSASRLAAAIGAALCAALTSCGGDDDYDFSKKPDAGVDVTTLPPAPPPPPPPQADAGDAEAAPGPCIELSDFVLDIVRNKTAETTLPEDLDDKTFCADKEDPKAYSTLFP